MSNCATCSQIRSDLAAATKAGDLIEAVKIAVKGARVMASQAPSVMRNFGR